jgi:hypothetical protein
MNKQSHPSLIPAVCDSGEWPFWVPGIAAQRRLSQPIYTYSMLFSDEAWIQAAAQLRQRQDAAQFLFNLSRILRLNLPHRARLEGALPAPSCACPPASAAINKEEIQLNHAASFWCAHDRLPLIELDRDYICTGTFLSDHLQETPITALIGEPGFSLVFQNGYILPILCPHCGQALHLPDIQALGPQLLGLSIINIGWDEDRQDPLILILGQPQQTAALPKALAVHYGSVSRLAWDAA